ncbi:hypothetical protein [Streptomyces albidoflavus]|uniref:hypothetical protein n=1 Tax=Streptomyces albidoflavus TaxID=1886 RepID=UPI0033CF0D30
MARLEEYEVDIASGVTVTMKLSPDAAEKADPKRVRKVTRAKGRPVANKARRPANKAVGSES